MIEIRNLSRSFGDLRAVDDISLDIYSGKITGFLGPNGAGKTTTMKMMVGYLQPNNGSIFIDGKDVFADPIANARKIGYLPEHNALYDDMYVFEALRYYADLRKMKAEEFAIRRDFVVSNCGLEDVITQKIGTLSKGYRQRVGIAQAILHDPEILILDEPTSGLDPNQIIEIRELIKELGKEKTVILSSHIMQEVQAVCDRVVIINRGKIAVDDDIENLGKHLSDKEMLVLEIEGDDIDLTDFYAANPSAVLVSEEKTADGVMFKIEQSPEESLRRELARFIADRGWILTSLFVQKVSLEEIFHDLTKKVADIPLEEDDAFEDEYAGSDMIEEEDYEPVEPEEIEEAELPIESEDIEDAEIPSEGEKP